MRVPFDFGQMYDDERCMPLDVSEFIKRHDVPMADRGAMSNLYFDEDESDEDLDAIADPR